MDKHDPILRQSNMELLRMVAMFLVLVVHADYLALGAPTVFEVQNASLSSFMRIWTESLSLVCVNVFILISGYFGIKPTVKSISLLGFQIIFYQLLIYMILILCGNVDFNIKDFFWSLIPTRSGWFVSAYFGLILISPILNCFVNKTTKNELRNYILIFYIVQSLGGWLTWELSMFDNGYSTVSFIGLYLIGRYVKKYFCTIGYSNFKYYAFGGYLTSTSLSAIIMYIVLKYIHNESLRERMQIYFMSYVAIQTVFASICLLLLFSRLQFQSKIVNQISISTFAVYLIHTNPMISSYYLSIIRYIDQNYEMLPFIGISFLFLLSVYLGCICLDKIRIYVWKFFWNILRPLAL